MGPGSKKIRSNIKTLEGVADSLSFHNAFSGVLQDTLISCEEGSVTEEISVSFDSVSKNIISGMEGDLVPYQLSMDNTVTAILFFCFFLTAYVLTNGKKMMFQQFKDYFQVKERGSLFAESTGVDLRYRLLLILQTSVLGGVCVFDYFHDHGNEVISHYPSWSLIAMYILAFIVFYVLKWWIYSFIAWIFIDKTKRGILIDSYFFMVCCLGLALFPVALLAVYFDLSSTILIPVILFIIVLTKLLMLYKGIKLFFDNLYGLFPIILYFCALELMPCLVMYQALIQINNLFLIKI